MDKDWRVALERWLAPYVEGLGNKTRRRMYPAYVMLSLRLFLPESWTSDAARLDKAGVPASLREYRTKPEIGMRRSVEGPNPFARSSEHSLTSNSWLAQL